MIDHESSEEEREQVLSWIREFNVCENRGFMDALAEGAEKDFFLVSRTAEGVVQGGLRGTLLLHWLKIEMMAVCPDDRDQGIGRELVREAEDVAMRAGCRYAYVDTMSYQAPDFYSKLGYTESGRLKDWDSHGYDKIFLTKLLPGHGD